MISQKLANLADAITQRAVQEDDVFCPLELVKFAEVIRAQLPALRAMEDCPVPERHRHPAFALIDGGAA